MVSLTRAGLALVGLACLSACNIGSGGETPPPAAAAVAPAPPPYVGLAGSLGQSLNAFSREAANKAELAALTTGETRTWRGDDGSYGYAAPGAANGDCRELTHTIYINGRPTSGKGKACKVDGGWKLNS